MGLFSKKKEKGISNIPELPKFEPDEELLADDTKKTPEIPSYESAFTKKDTEVSLPPVNLKEEIPTIDDLDMPIREPSFNKPKPVYNERVPEGQLDELIPKKDISQDFKSPFKKETTPNKELEISFEKTPKVEEKKSESSNFEIGKNFKLPKKIIDNRPVFVQIDDYKDAMNNIEVLKQKIREVEYMLDRLNEIKSEEQIEISNCETSLNKIKESLIGIDKKLFEI
tara:strand:+ start:638 stop:1315 length:678 start_codon:yes stop_codon:yes gene_type:complete